MIKTIQYGGVGVSVKAPRGIGRRMNNGTIKREVFALNKVSIYGAWRLLELDVGHKVPTMTMSEHHKSGAKP